MMRKKQTRKFYDNNDEFRAEFDSLIDNRWTNFVTKLKRIPVFVTARLTRRAGRLGKDYAFWWSRNLIEKSIKQSNNKEAKSALEEVLESIQKKEFDVRRALNG